MKILLSAVVVLLVTVATFADIARPEPSPTPVKKSKSVESSLTIRLDNKTTEPTLVIPRSELKQLKAELEGLDLGDDSATVSSPASRLQLIGSGVFLGLAFVFGGMWFIRSGRSSGAGKAAAVLAFVAATGAAGTLIYANIAPPMQIRTISTKLFSKAVMDNGYASGKIKLELAPSGAKGVVLIVPDPSADGSGE